MILGNRRTSWQLWEKYSYVAVEISNISQVYAVFGLSSFDEICFFYAVLLS